LAATAKSDAQRIHGVRDIPDFDDFFSNGCFQNLATHAFVTYALSSGALPSKKIMLFDN